MASPAPRYADEPPTLGGLKGVRRREGIETAFDVDRDDLVAEPLQRITHARARAQRDLALERLAAREDRDEAHPARRRSGTT